MGGIAGFFSKKQVYLREIEFMIASQAHRGPHEQGFVLGLEDGSHQFYPSAATLPRANGSWALGQCRLKAMDFCATGQQPLGFGRRYWIVFDGTLYNAKELRRELQLMGYAFASTSDTEVALLSYITWGIHAFEQFNGAWALAILDLRERELLLSRDRMGEKPLFYLDRMDLFAFASEAKGLFTLHREDRKLHLDAARRYLYHEFVHMANSESFFRDIRPFPPGHYVKIPYHSFARWVSEPYWDVAEAVVAQRRRRKACTLEEAETELQALLTSSVHLRMRSEAEVGFAFSGGLAASTLACLGAEQTKDISLPRLFSLQGENCEAALRGELTTFSATPDAFLENLPKLLWNQEAPFASLETYAQWQFFQYIQKAGIRVLLDGRGAVELLFGDPSCYSVYLQHLAQQGKWITWLKTLRARYQTPEDGGWTPYLQMLSPFKKPETPSITTPDFEAYFQCSPATAPLSHKRGKEPFCYQQLRAIRDPDFFLHLRQQARNAMTWSVETRHPFLDHRLWEFLLSLPEKLTLSGGKTYSLLRTAFRARVPQAVLTRQTRTPAFSMNWDAWFCERLWPFMLSWLQAHPIAKKWIIFHNINENTVVHRQQLWRLFLFFQWAERFQLRL